MTPDQQAPPDQPAAPVLRILTENTTEEEIAALVAVLAALGGEEPLSRTPRRAWNHPARLVRTSYAVGLGGWRASGLPR